jgi:HlyD family secretion protein
MVALVESGTPIIELGDPTTLDAITQVLSTDAVSVHPGARVTIEGWGGTLPLAAGVRRVEASAFTKVSALGIEEQRVEVIAWIERPPPTLGDRSRVRVRIVTWEAADVLQAPVSALSRDGRGWYVYVVLDGRARRRDVELGHRSNRQAEVVSGLADGDVVIPYPSDQISDGTRVRAA